ncbi:MAG: hypothetical protein V2A56_01070 [bacterium]
MSRGRWLIGTLAAMLCAAPLLAQSVSESMDNAGTIDWSSQWVRARGIAVPGGVGGRAGQIRAAELDALRQILETVKGMRLSSTTLVENYMLSSDVIRTRVEGVARNFRRVGDPVYMDDGSIEVTVEMALTGPGKLYDAVLPQQMGGAQPVFSSPPSNVGNGSAFSGLIIDARDLGVRPAISPQILDEHGDVIYGSRVVDRQWAIQYGLMGYAKELESARQDDRVSPNPLVVKAIRATGANRTDVVIDDMEARILHGIAKNYNFLRQGRVIILVD